MMSIVLRRRPNVGNSHVRPDEGTAVSTWSRPGALSFGKIMAAQTNFALRFVCLAVLFCIGMARCEETEPALEDAPPDSADFSVAGGDETVLIDDTQTARVFKSDGTLTIKGEGYVELLMVGGGGGGGLYNGGSANGGCGGGGAGGLIHHTCFAVTAGSYSVTVGLGGEAGRNGGDTKLFDLTAFGGGAGGDFPANSGSDGGSGGGSCGDEFVGGKAIHLDDGNLGNHGGSASHGYGAAGGGGAGEAGEDHRSDGASRPGKGGDGYACAILGMEKWFAGGGAGARRDCGFPALGGKGGGGNGLNAIADGRLGSPGEDGTGGGGAGSAPGGSGIVIVRFRSGNHAPTYRTAFDGATGGTIEDKKVGKTTYRFHTFTANGTFTIPCEGRILVLLVGGGGGGGSYVSSDGNVGSAGGGAGGLIYTERVLTPGAYQVVIGAGGALDQNGANSTAFGLTAYGGGAGGKPWGRHGGDGGSGGGSTFNGERKEPGRAAYAAEGNIGHDGGSAEHAYGPAGGGGAGAVGHDIGINMDTGAESAVRPAAGGDGLACDISFEDVYYAGGGAGFRPGYYAPGGLGGGGACNYGTPTPGENGKGGGGCGNAAGGSGILIIRYMLPPVNTVITFR